MSSYFQAEDRAYTVTYIHGRHHILWRQWEPGRRTNTHDNQVKEASDN